MQHFKNVAHHLTNPKQNKPPKSDMCQSSFFEVVRGWGILSPHLTSHTPVLPVRRLAGQPKKQSCLSTLSWHDKRSALTTFSPSTVSQPSPRPKVPGHENDGADVFGQHTIHESPTTRMRYKPSFLTQPALRYNKLNHHFKTKRSLRTASHLGD